MSWRRWMRRSSSKQSPSHTPPRGPETSWGGGWRSPAHTPDPTDTKAWSPARTPPWHSWWFKHKQTQSWHQIKSHFLESKHIKEGWNERHWGLTGFSWKSYLKSSISAPKKVLKLLCWLMWLSSFSLMFPNTCRKQLLFILLDQHWFCILLEQGKQNVMCQVFGEWLA